MRIATSQLSSLLFFSSVYYYYRMFRIGQGNTGRSVCLRQKNTIENGFRRINRIFLLFKFSTEQIARELIRLIDGRFCLIRWTMEIKVFLSSVSFVVWQFICVSFIIARCAHTYRCFILWSNIQYSSGWIERRKKKTIGNAKNEFIINLRT